MYKHSSSLWLALYFSASYCLGSETLEFNDKLYGNRFQTIDEMVNYLTNKTLVTEHLSISLTKEENEDDIDQLSKLFIGQDWLWMYTMDKKNVPTNENDAKNWLTQRNLTKINPEKDKVKNKVCFCTIKLRDQNTCIGQLGVTFVPKDNNGYKYCMIWTAYWIGKNYSGKKYMSEICPPMFKFFLETYEPDIDLQLLFVVHNENGPSHRLAEKICLHINQNNKYFYSKEKAVFKKNPVIHRALWKKKGILFYEKGKPEEEQKKKDKRLCSCCPCC